MLGAIIGDMVGSLYEFCKPDMETISLIDCRSKMTDDSYLTLAVIKVLSNNYPIKFDKDSQNKIQKELIKEFIRTWRSNQDCGFGAMFYEWCHLNQYNDEVEFNKSIGNGAAMRISSVGYVCNSIKEIKILSKTITEVTHNSKEGLKSAECMAVAIYLARKGYSKLKIKEYLSKHYYPELESYYPDLISMENSNLFQLTNCSCLARDTVPVALTCFLSSSSYMDALKKALRIGGDTDTLCSMTLAVSEAFYSLNRLNKFEQAYLYWKIDPDVEKTLVNFYNLIGSQKMKGKK